MPHHEIPPMNLVTLDLFRTAHLDADGLAGVVAALARGLGVARRAELGLKASLRAVSSPCERGVVTQERLGQGAPKILLLVTRAAHAGFPLRLVLVAAEARAHRRQRLAGLPHHPRVTRHALTTNLWQSQVGVVLDADLAVGTRRLDVQHGSDTLTIGAMTGFAQCSLGQLELPIGLRRGVARIAAQTSRLPGGAAGDAY
jgi:hypothetical protein